MMPLCAGQHEKHGQVLDHGRINARNTNRELKINSSALDRRISGLPQAGGRALDPDRISDTLAFLVSERIRVSAILANRRIEGTENVVDLIRCFTGNSAL
jgi:hypothetical protein